MDNEPLRDRTYQEVINGDYMDNKQYMVVAVLLGITHCLMEVFYIWVGCTPMVYINILSILSYVVSAVLISKGKQFITVWIMESEISWHVILACIFMGIKCGYHLWLFGTFSSIFLPFFIPNLSKKPKKQIGIYAICIVVIFEILVYMGRRGYLPTKYNVDDSLAEILYYFNAVLGFVSIMIYTSIYNRRMAMKNDELQFVADHDSLTGIYNRNKIQSILEAEVSRKADVSEGNLSVAILDVDHFKRINDTYGHQTGDSVLKSITECFKKYREKGLIYGRWGGEEFLLISPETISYDEFGNMLEDLRKTVEELKLTAGGETIKTSVSIGAASYEEKPNMDKLLKKADDRLYEAKENGRNKVVLNG
ncbi:MAG: GGDEF domain-containing protein [Butyrivibrio sp.]|nr:GGDEF domain-containing protein [Butyrivibrio sp.]